jgi:hypothetical protein
MRFRSTLMAALVLAAGIAICSAVVVADGRHRPPTQEDIAFAKTTTDLLFNTLFAALTQEFDETIPENVEQGKQSIGLVFSDAHSNFRLVGTFRPLSENDRPRDSFERKALRLALDGGQAPADTVERVEGDWFYRRSIPLSVFRTQCALCHANFTGLGADDWVGALMLKVPIR